MQTIIEIKRPSKTERKIAKVSYPVLTSAIRHLKTEQAEIEIEETGEKIKIPVIALNLLREILKAMSQGKPFSLVPQAMEVTTQRAADILGCSRPFLVKLLEESKIPFTRVGKHRRIQLNDVMKLKQQLKDDQKKHLIEIMKSDELAGLYDT